MNQKSVVALVIVGLFPARPISIFGVGFALRQWIAAPMPHDISRQ